MIALPSSDPTSEEIHDSRGPTWPWANALSAASPGRSYRVVRILFAMVRDRCLELGCVEGAVITCAEVDDRTITFVGRDGRRGRLLREYALFVQVEGVG